MSNNIFKINFLDETPDDVKKIIYKYTIPPSPPMPEKTEIYNINIRKMRFMDYLVKYYDTSYEMKKIYNNITDLFYKLIDEYIMKLKNIPYSKCFSFNKLVTEFCYTHSSIQYRKNRKNRKQIGI